MAAGVPPPPLNSPSGSYYWLEWYTSLTNFLNGTNIPWSNLNFSGSNLTDIQTRNHNDLQNIQGGLTTQRWHGVGQGNVTAGGATSVVPSGWVVTHPGAGIVQLAHNLGIATTNMVAVANLNQAVSGLCQTNITSINAFEVRTFNLAGAPTDLPFTFYCGAL